MLLALALATAATAVPPAPPQPAPARAPVSVRVDVSPKVSKTDALVASWAGELRTALAERKSEFRPPRPAEKPELLVRIDGVSPAPGGGERHVMNFVCERSGQTKPFNITYGGDVRAYAEKLARNLLGLTDSMRTQAPPAGPSTPAGTKTPAGGTKTPAGTKPK